MTTISLYANDQLLTVTLKPKIASGDKNSVLLHVDFDSIWDRFTKSAVFFTTNDATVYEIILTDGECTVPHEVLAQSGTLYIGVRGVAADNAVKTSTLVKYKIDDGAPVGDGTTVDPTPDVYQQILKRLNNLEQGAVSDERLASAVEVYLDSHPVNGLSSTEKTLILTLFRNAAYTSANMSNVLVQLEALWDGGEVEPDIPDVPDIPDEPEHTHSYTSSVTTAATCETAGVRTYVCSCGHSYTETIAAIGHNYVDGACTNCGAADPDYEESAEPLYAFENVDSYEIKDRYNSNGTEIYVTITNGNHVKIFGEKGSSNWYLNKNFSSLSTNGADATALTETWFTIPANAEVEMKLANINCEATTTNLANALFYFADVNGTKIISANLKDLGGSTERTVTATVTADTAIKCMIANFMKNANEYFEFDVELWVNGERWI